MNEYTIAQIQPGLTARFSRTITSEMEDAFRTLSGDENPLHYDDAFAGDMMGFPQHAAFGMLTASLYSTLAGMYLPGKYSLIHSLENLTFQKPVFSGDTLTVEGIVEDVDPALKLIRVRAVIKNQDSKTVSKAKMKILVLK